MASIGNELLLEPMKQVQDRLGRVEVGITDIMAELRAHKSLLGALISQEAVQDGRVAELAARVDRIEHRLELREAE